LVCQPYESLPSTITKNFPGFADLLRPTSSAPSLLPEDSPPSDCLPGPAGFRAPGDCGRAISPAECPFHRLGCRFDNGGFWKRGNIVARGERERQMPQGHLRSEIRVSIVDILCIMPLIPL
jgi:hypothetical protein